uniref:Uncharacterized protein n=1 Tax=Strongyloides venezuelensis TaxID=75913 RepID=A0A0K0EZT9_STRVS
MKGKKLKVIFSKYFNNPSTLPLIIKCLWLFFGTPFYIPYLIFFLASYQRHYYQYIQPVCRLRLSAVGRKEED